LPASDRPGDDGKETVRALTPATLVPICGAIFVFGVLYGATAQPLFGPLLTMASSVLVFSGTAQFTMVGLVAAAASPISVLWAVFVVNVRNFALGGALRPHLHGGFPRRLGLSWFLIDETVGLALVHPASADRVVLVSGAFAYGSWVLGTVLGVVGGATWGLEALATSVFPVLFIGLAGLMVHNRGMAVRAVAGAIVTLVLLLVWPDLAGMAPVVAGIVAALPGGAR